MSGIGPPKFEARTVGWNEEIFQHFCNTLLASMASKHYGPGFSADLTARTKHPDHGVDALVRVHPGEEDKSGGVVGSGLTAYQYKFSDPATARAQFLARLGAELEKQLPKIQQTYPELSRYVLLTNRDLGPPTSKYRKTLKDQFNEAWGPNPPSFEIKGGAELDSYHVDYPAVFRAFDPSPSLETNRERLQLLRDAGRRLGAPSELVGRESEARALSECLSQRGGGLLFVVGPPRIGKSSLAARTIEEDPARGARTFWVVPPYQMDSRAILKDLSAQGCAAVIFDEITTPEEANRLVQISLEFPELKRIFLFRKELMPSEPSARPLPLEPLDFQDRRELLNKIGFIDSRLREWIAEMSGGVPGVLLEYAAASRELQDPISDRELVNRVDKKLADLYLGDDSRSARLAAWIALCGFVNLDSPSESAERVARFFGLEVGSPAERQDLDELSKELAARGVLKRLGPLVRFEAPFLARTLAKQFLVEKPGAILELLAKSGPDEWARLFGLLEAKREDPRILQLAAEVIGSFEDLGRLLDRLDIFVAAGRINPEQAARQAEWLFTGSPSQLSAILGDASRWKILNFLKHCFHENSESATAAVRALTEVAIAEETGARDENKRKLPIADEYLLPFWTRLHWRDIPVPLEQRISLIDQLADSEDPIRRLLAIKAAVAVLAPLVVDYHSTQEGFALPRTQVMSATWGEVFRYSEASLNLLARLATDRDSRVAGEAFEWACKSIPQATLLGASPEALTQVLHDLTGRAETPKRRELLRRGTRTALQDLDRAAPSGDGRLQAVKQVLQDGAAKVQVTSFGDQLVEVFSDRHAPRDHGPSLWEWTPSPAGRFEPGGVPQFEQALELARQAARTKELLSADLHEFLAGSSHGGIFWWLVGQEDSSRSWRDLLLDPAYRWRDFFSSYAGGWTAVAPDDADAYLDELSTESSNHGLVLSATARQWPTSHRAERLLKILDSGTEYEWLVAGILDSGPWLGNLEEDQALPLLRRLAHSPDERVLHRVYRNLHDRLLPNFRARFGEETHELAWETLEHAIGRKGKQSVSWEWQMLAATLARIGDADRAFGLIEQLARRDPTERGLIVDFPSVFHWDDLREALSAADRPRLARLWLRLAFETPEPWRELLVLERPLDPRLDGEAVLSFVGTDPERAKAVWLLIGGTDKGYLDLARDILKKVPRTEELWNAIFRHFALGEAFFGPPSLYMSAKIQALKESLNCSQTPPAYSAWAAWAIRELEFSRRVREQWEFVSAFQDGKPTADEAIAILEAPPEDPQRRWLIRRILEQEKPSLARELLGEEEIERAITDRDLDSRIAKLWTERLGRKEPSWRS